MTFEQKAALIGLITEFIAEGVKEGSQLSETFLVIDDQLIDHHFSAWELLEAVQELRTEDN